jgi:LysR family nod box-dependent transcriptional activator
MPLQMPPLVQAMQWHKYRGDDAGLLWLRLLLQQAVALIDTEHPGEP